MALERSARRSEKSERPSSYQHSSRAQQASSRPPGSPACSPAGAAVPAGPQQGARPPRASNHGDEGSAAALDWLLSGRAGWLGSRSGPHPPSPPLRREGDSTHGGLGSAIDELLAEGEGHAPLGAVLPGGCGPCSPGLDLAERPGGRGRPAPRPRGWDKAAAERRAAPSPPVHAAGSPFRGRRCPSPGLWFLEPRREPPATSAVGRWVHETPQSCRAPERAPSPLACASGSDSEDPVLAVLLRAPASAVVEESAWDALGERITHFPALEHGGGSTPWCSEGSAWDV
eukprot:CAMPEP_0177578038 /NCGR_PEP_ID=MMETSP0419_2-20121207/113_1 /TAXON_ID=582737 /ORGANISM="Tetraselmis sp., Strain GSL018" /LENGTH=285 /DNA_ID=CAMNT_0019066411 /DNA_START=758 /DNA_END=1615 /DNA_ORIENTATION=-